MKIKMVCKHCGSDNVHLDAYADWDEDTQQWVLGSTYDHEFCSDCERDGHNVIDRQEIQEKVEVPDERC